MSKLLIERMNEYAVLPKKHYETDSGFDLVGLEVKAIYENFGSNGEHKIEGEAMAVKFPAAGVLELQCNERALIGTGIKATVGPGYELQIRPRSGLAWKQGLTIVNTPGTIDEQFRGEVCVIIMNTSRALQRITLGTSIAQLVPVKVELFEIEEAELAFTKRGDRGFGSTDEKKKKKKDRPFNVVSK